MYLGGPIFGRRVLENTPIPLFEQILNSSPMGVFSRDYGTCKGEKIFCYKWVVSRLARIRSCQNDGLLHCSVENAVVSCENHRERLRQHELDFHL